MKIYHNPRCSKSRETLNLLKERGLEPTVIEYLKTPPSISELHIIIHQLGIKPVQLVRKSEALYKDRYANKTFTDEEWLQILVQNPILIERPIFINNGKAVMGRPPQNVFGIL